MNIVKFYRAKNENSSLPSTMDSNGLYILDSGKLVDGKTKKIIGRDETDFVFTQNFKTSYSWGPFTKGDDIIKAGDTLSDFLEKFNPDTPELAPVPTYPSIVFRDVSAVDTKSSDCLGRNVEIGTQLNVSFNVVFQAGEYPYGTVTDPNSNSTGITANTDTYTLSTGNNNHEFEETLQESICVTTVGANSIVGTYTGGYSQGYVPLGSKGTSFPNKQIPASSGALTTSKKICDGFQNKIYICAFDEKFSASGYHTNSEYIRNNGVCISSSLYTGTFTAPKGTKCICVYTLNSSSRINKWETSGFDIKEVFEKTSNNVTITGMNKFTSDNLSFSYTVQQFSQNVGTSSPQTYNIVIS